MSTALPFVCAICGLEGVGPLWFKLKVWRQDKRTWTKENAPVHSACIRRGA